MRTLVMSFKTGEGKAFKITLDDVRDDILPEDILAAMNLAISKNIFDVKGEVTEIDTAKIITTDTEELALV